MVFMVFYLDLLCCFVRFCEYFMVFGFLLWMRGRHKRTFIHSEAHREV